MTDHYEQELFGHFIGFKDYSKFKRAIVDKLSRHGIVDWAYAPLDIPTELAGKDYLGTIKEELRHTYMEEAFYESDLLMRHVNKNHVPIFHSDIDHFLRSCPIHTEELERNKQLVKLNKRLGYNDSYCIPVGDKRKGDRALFSITTTTMTAEDFRGIVTEKQQELFTLGTVINNVGIINFPELFIKNKTALEKFVFSQPFNLMTTMIKYDLTVAEVAERFNIKPDTAKKQLIKARKTLGAKTYAGAFAAAIRQGIIDSDCNYIPP